MSTIEIKPSEKPGTDAQCPVVGCDYMVYSRHRMLDHLGPDGHDLLGKALDGEVRINE